MDPFTHSHIHRATAFMQLQVSGLVGNLVSPALSSAMMALTGPWPAMLVAFSCLMLAAIAFLFVPETLNHKAGNESGIELEDRPSSLKGISRKFLMSSKIHFLLWNPHRSFCCW